MKPKNIKQRRSGFLKFLLLFTLVTISIVGLVFFNFRVPKKENKLLKARMINVEREMDFQREFSKEMLASLAMIDSLDIPGQNLQFLNSLIGKKLAELQATIPRKDSTYRYDMYTEMVKTLVDLQEAKKRLKTLEDSENRIKEYQEELDRTRQRLTEAERELRVLSARN